MAYRNKLNDIVAAYSGTDTAANTATAAGKGTMQFEIDGSAGENQILLINNGSGASVTVELLIPFEVEGRYTVETPVITLAAGVERAISEFTRSVYGNLEDAATPADSTANWAYFNIYTGDKIVGGGTIVEGTEYVVLAGPVAVDSGTYTVGQAFTATANDVTDFDALSGGEIVAKTAGASVKMKLLKKAA